MIEGPFGFCVNIRICCYLDIYKIKIKSMMLDTAKCT
jgi:hypothetical protein